MQITAIAGGIGAGKSVVSHMVATMGWPVYDCDSRSKLLVDSSPALIRAIGSEVCTEAVNDSGSLNRAVLAERVFTDIEALNRLNALVHEAVRLDIEAWIASLVSPIAFIETAILYQSGLDLMVDNVWLVTAPESLRISRVIRRNALSERQVSDRIAAQDNYIPSRTHSHVSIIINDDINPLLPQITNLLSQY